MNEKRDCMPDGREIEIISIEKILQKISRSTANLADEEDSKLHDSLLHDAFEKY